MLLREIPTPKSQAKFNTQAQKECSHDPPFFEMIDEKMRVSSRASEASASRSVPLFLVNPVSINRKNKRLSFASLRQIFRRIRKSFLLRASSASIQFAATEPERGPAGERPQCCQSFAATVSRIRAPIPQKEKSGLRDRVVSFRRPFW
jgi:hypothetical protein